MTTLHRTLSRTRNRWYDALAVLNGYCNRRSNITGVPGEGGGYRHWRCALRRHHDGMHRVGNYVWTDDGTTSYLPAPPGSGKEAWQPRGWDRTMTPTLRQERKNRRWQAEQSAKRRAARTLNGS